MPCKTCHGQGFAAFREQANKHGQRCRDGTSMGISPLSAVLCTQMPRHSSSWNTERRWRYEEVAAMNDRQTLKWSGELAGLVQVCTRRAITACGEGSVMLRRGICRVVESFSRRHRPWIGFDRGEQAARTFSEPGMSAGVLEMRMVVASCESRGRTSVQRRRRSSIVHDAVACRRGRAEKSEGRLRGVTCARSSHCPRSACDSHVIDAAEMCEAVLCWAGCGW